MDIRHLNIGILHSLIGKNDGVSIVIDQTVNSMVQDMGIDLGNIFFLCAHTSPRFNATTDEVFWHKSPMHKLIVQNYEEEPRAILDNMIHSNAKVAEDIISEWVDRHKIDLIIAHNTSHPLNFITAVGLGYYLESLRKKNIVWPKVMVWWHDSYFERERFANPNPVIKKYLKYLPGTEIDGIAFINNQQPKFAKEFFKLHGKEENIKDFFEDRTAVVPNTSEIPWSWEYMNKKGNIPIAPPIDKYNRTFLVDIGLVRELKNRDYSIKDTVILLQHTRIVPRKRIEVAIDLAFRLSDKFKNNKVRKCISLIVSGHSGDEQMEYKQYLQDYYEKKLVEYDNPDVILIFAEEHILSHRDIIVDKKYYKFAEIPSIIAAYRGLGTYFSDVEGYGNNLLEMVSYGLPVAINKYEIYKEDIDHLGFRFPATEDCVLTDEVVDESYEILTDIRVRNEVVYNNLEVLSDKLDHKLIAKKIKPIIRNIFIKRLH